MEENINKQIEIQSRLTALVKGRQTQLSELKCYFDLTNKRLYKDVILISDNLQSLEELLGKSTYRLRVENLYSLIIGLGKVLDLNNSIKTILLSLKIFEEQESYSKTQNNQSKSFIYKMFERNDSVPLIKNEMTKNKFLSNVSNTENNYTTQKDFYTALYRTDGNFWTDFNKYLNFQMDPKQKNKDNQFKVNDFAGKLYKLYSGSTVNYYKFYSRNALSFDLDYASLVVQACDVFFMLYNKFLDKICHQQNLNEYVSVLDNFILKNFIEILSEDLQRLSEHIAKREMDELLRNLDKLYN